MLQICVCAESAKSADALRLQAALGDALQCITGSSGNTHFHAEDTTAARSVFAVARQGENAVGCGALRALDETRAEIKRVYAALPRQGIGSAVLQFLEAQARTFGYACTVLETRRCNTVAVQFYLHHGYTEIPNYGMYAAHPECICFEKKL